MDLRKALEKHRDELMAMTGVVGVGEGIFDGKPCIKIFVARKSPRILHHIPSAIEGYIVSIEETGEFKALQ